MHPQATETCTRVITDSPYRTPSVPLFEDSMTSVSRLSKVVLKCVRNRIKPLAEEIIAEEHKQEHDGTGI